ncbi:hypothetical protein VD0001_g5593 [Verticillium dahliae]|nr:hypothetical protein VD0001_g5593 [Verticillium dahliae]
MMDDDLFSGLVKSFATTHLNISRATFFAIHTARN